ncbi:PmbA/TldA family metallopeptidase, partial [Methylogaea oryzae]
MKNDTLAVARRLLLEPTGIGDDDVSRLMGELFRSSLDAADIYFQASRYESWQLEDGIVKEGSYSIERGAGLRAVTGEKTGFAYSDQILMPELLEAARCARAIAAGGGQGSVKVAHGSLPKPLYPMADPLASLGEEAKIDLLRRVDAEARRIDPRVEQVIVSLAGVHEAMLVVDQSGVMHGDVRPLVRLNVS